MVFTTVSCYMAYPSLTVKSSKRGQSVDRVINPGLPWNVLLQGGQTVPTTAIKDVKSLNLNDVLPGTGHYQQKKKPDHVEALEDD